MSAELAMFGNVISAVSQFLTPDTLTRWPRPRVSVQRTSSDNDCRLVTEATKDALKQAPVYQEKR